MGRPESPGGGVESSGKLGELGSFLQEPFTAARPASCAPFFPAGFVPRSLSTTRQGPASSCFPSPCRTPHKAVLRGAEIPNPGPKGAGQLAAPCRHSSTHALPQAKVGGSGDTADLHPACPDALLSAALARPYSIFSVFFHYFLPDPGTGDSSGCAGAPSGSFLSSLLFFFLALFLQHVAGVSTSKANVSPGCPPRVHSPLPVCGAWEAQIWEGGKG